MSKYKSLIEHVSMPISRVKSIENTPFNEWDAHVIDVIKNTPQGSVYHYATRTDRALLDACNMHIKEHSRELTAENQVILVHPFFMHVKNHEYIAPVHEKAVAEYLDNIAKLCSNRNGKYDIIIMDSAHSYALGSSKLLVNGAIDGVIITKPFGGHVDDVADLKMIRDKDTTFGGTFNKLCLSAAISDSMYAFSSDKRVYAFKDLCIEGVGESEYLFAKDVHYAVFGNNKILDPSRMMTVNEYLRNFR
jgi:hypothetical protein